MSLAKDKIQFYRSMASLHEAGLPIIKALRHRHPQRLRPVCEQIAYAIEQGEGNLSDILRFYPKLFSPMEQRLIAVGEKTGRLDESFKGLADWFETFHELRRKVIGALLYPLFLYHIAALICPFLSVFLGGNLIVAVLQSLALLIPLYAFLLLVILYQAHLLPARTLIQSLILSLPIIGSISRKLDYARFFKALSFSLQAGISAPESVRLAAGTCAKQSVQQLFSSISERMDELNCPFTEAGQLLFPDTKLNQTIIDLYTTGETSGTTDKAAASIAKLCHDEASNALDTMARIVPKIIYILIVLYMAVNILLLFIQLFKKTGILGS